MILSLSIVSIRGFHKYITLAIMPILTSGALLRENKQKQNKILGSESFARWLIYLVLALELELVLELVLELELELSLALEIELVLALDIEHYHITASVNHLTCPLPPHQSVI